MSERLKKLLELERTIMRARAWHHAKRNLHRHDPRAIIREFRTADEAYSFNLMRETWAK